MATRNPDQDAGPGRADAGRGPRRESRQEKFARRAEVCRVLTDPKRLMIIEALRDGERSVGELAAELACTMPNASQHLTVLRAAGLVAGRRDGTTVYYRLAEPGIAQACDLVAAIADRLRGPAPTLTRRS